MKYPLQIYIIWKAGNYSTATKDPCFQLAETIFSSFNRKVKEPLERGVGIPIYFISDRTALANSIQWEAAVKTVVVWFITEEMLLEADHLEWKKELHQLLESSNQPLIIPVALTKNADSFSKRLENNDWVLLKREEDWNSQKDFLVNKLALYLIEKLQPTGKEELTLFISHNKKDGSGIAAAIREVVEQDELNIGVYTDTPSLGKKGRFESQLEEQIGQSIFLIINTNLYNEEDYCLQVLLKAKKENRPVVLLNAQYKVTYRVWPYLGNIPTVQLPVIQGDKSEKGYLKVLAEEGEKVYEEVVHYIFLEALRSIYQQQFLRMLIQNVQKRAVPFGVAPELLTLHQQGIVQGQLVLYPDPPLGATEMQLLKKYFNTSIITPTLYPILRASILEEEGQDYQTILEDCVVGFSVSEPPAVEQGKYQGVSIWHLQDALVELARYLLMCGATPAYGGRLQYQAAQFNLTAILVSLSRTYNSHTNATMKIKNHLIALDEEQAKKETALQLGYSDVVEFIRYDSLEHTQQSSTPLIKKAQNALNLSNIRQRTFKEHNDAQLFIGGKLKGYSGLLPGLIEEAYWALKEGCPIYVVGAFGGSAGALAELLLKGESEDFRQTLEQQQQQEGWQQLYQQYLLEAQQCPTWEEQEEQIRKRVYYQHLQLFFLKERQKAKGNYINNGLSKEENEQLFTTKNILQISSLVLKGLHSYFNEFK